MESKSSTGFTLYKKSLSEKKLIFINLFLILTIGKQNLSIMISLNKSVDSIKYYMLALLNFILLR